MTPNPFASVPFAPNGPTHYEIVDGQTGAKVGTAKTRAAASRAVDRRDNAYGAYRYRARAVYAESAQ
jgi:hypothetical protein